MTTMSRYLGWYLYDKRGNRSKVVKTKDFGIMVSFNSVVYVLDDEYLEQIEKGHHKGLRLEKPKRVIINQFFNGD